MQKAGGVAAYVDAEHALDIDYAKKLGVNIEDLLVSQPDTGEQALEIVEILVRSGAVDIVVIDSVAALVPKAEIEGEMGDSHVGLQARLMSQALRKLAGAINRSNCAVVFINQLREKIGVMFGNPETTTGGKALKFYASLRLDIRRIGPVKERETVIGNHVRVKVVKNKVAPPFRQAEFDIMFDEGISHTSLLVDLASEANIIQKSGAWYSYGDQRIGQGRENAKLFLRDNPPLMAEVEGKVKELLGMHAGGGRRRRRRRGRRASDACRSSRRSSPIPAARARCGSRWTGSGSAPCPQTLAHAAGLAVGRPVDAELQERLSRGRRRGGAPSGRCSARSSAGRSPGSIWAAGWSGRGIRAPAVEAALERAAALGLLDDAAFAAELRRRPGRRGGGAPPGSRGTCMAMGVERGAHRPRARRRVARGRRPHAACRSALAAKRAAQLGDLPRQVKRRRLLAYLARRGFSGAATVSRVMVVAG